MPAPESHALTIDLWTFDIGAAADSPEAFAAACIDRAADSWTGGADLVLFPEYLWAGLGRFPDAAKREHPVRTAARLFWEDIWPALLERHYRHFSGKAAVLGTAPFFEPESRRLRNRSPILLSGGRAAFQDKICLTPWEKSFAGGESLKIHEFLGWRFAVLVCLDIEIPELAVQLREQAVDLLLVPSATESILGCERIARCASARAVELGCYVAVAHLTGGDPALDLIDENLGRTAFFAPSQAPFLETEREARGKIHRDGFHRTRVVADPAALAAMRADRVETNPARLRPTVSDRD
ncbi:MAG: hypothetical protein KDM91_14515 [Verrucomicrobiae bacterium]|nr:hypothetical protein [Verrucomicrobiae bacterium]MCP5540699.1 hypothetical protein [Akkermansiaceae bacterium]